MHIQDIFRSNPTTISFEFFPPKTAEASESLYQTILELEKYLPHFVSVTYGAGGSTRQLTHDLVVRIKNDTKLDPIPHLTCVCHREAEISSILERYASAGVSNILALGGDPPRADGYRREDDDFQHAADLVKFIRKFNDSGAHPDPRGFGIGVAGFPEGHPATPNRLLEMDHLKRKVDAGADYVVTQLFFDNRDFLDSATGANWRASACRSSPASCRSPPWAGSSAWPSWPAARASPRSSCAPSSAAATIPKGSRGWASITPPSNATTCWKTRSEASTSIP